ncbi:MAG: HAMP domain-containing sensor histidine kinase [Mariprofundaceae bacterium]|nr:HAMP domain-containing sensor histidine kinase [Mariprofundaceae bacterium]
MHNNSSVNWLYLFRQMSPAYFAMVILLIAALTYFFYSLSHDLATDLEADLKSAFDQQNQMIVDIASSRVGFHITNDVAENVRLLGQFPAIQRLELHNGTRDIEKVNTFAAPRVDGFVLFKANGDFFTAYPESMYFLYAKNQSNTDFFKNTKETNSLYFSNWIRRGDRLKMRVSSPIYNRIVDINFPPPNNRLSGIMMAQIDFDRTIASELGRLKSSGIMHWIIDEKSGDVLYHSMLPRISLKKSIESVNSHLAKALLQAFPSKILEPGIHRTKINDTEYSIASARSFVGPHKIIVNLAYDDSQVASLVHEKTNRVYLLGVAFLVMISFGGIFMLRQMARRQLLLSDKEHLTKELALEAEKKQLRDQVFQLQKMESLGTLAAGTAHELNNALSGPMGMISILQVKPDIAPEKRDKMFESAIEGMNQARAIVESLLRFSRSENDERVLSSINDDIRLCLDLFAKEFDHVGIKPKLTLADHLPPILAAHRQLQQVFLNLFGNAKHAMPNGGFMFIQSKAEKNGVMITVRDTGIGMSEDTCARIFEPFFSTKPTGEGTGLGLSVCYGIMQDHEGQMTVTSELGEGSEFSIWLPTEEIG